MTLGSVWVGLGLLAHSHVTTITAFYAVWIWLGLGLAATLYSPAFAVVTRRFAQDFRRAIITLTFLGGLASTVFIPLSSWWIELWGWRQALWALAALQLLVCAPLHAWLLQGAAPPACHSDGHPQPRTSVRVHLKRAPFWLLAVFSLFMMAVTSALPAHMIALLQEAQLPPAWVIAIPAAIGVIQVLGRLLLFMFERRWDVHTANRWIPTLIPLGLLALLIGGFNPLASLVFVLLYGLGNGMNTIVKGTAMAQYVSRHHVGQLNGLLGVPIALARAAAPLTVGLLWSPARGYGLALWWLLLASTLGTAALWLAQHRALRHATH
jgi:predicted MFS family arabinose efflux permease